MIPLAEKGNKLYEQGMSHEALELYDKAIRTDPKNADLWNSRGLALCHLGMYDEAIRHFDRIIKIAPGYSKAWYNRGVIFRSLVQQRRSAQLPRLECWREVLL